MFMGLSYAINKPLDKLFFIIVVFFIFLVILFNYVDLFSKVLKRFSNITSTDKNDYSTGLRIYRGFAVYGSLDIQEKIFGIGFGNMANYIYSYGITTPYDYYVQSEEAIEYMSGFSSVLVQTGIIGLAAFVYFLLKTFLKCSIVGKIITIEFLLIMLTGSDLFSVSSPFILFLIFAFDKERLCLWNTPKNC